LFGERRNGSCPGVLTCTPPPALCLADFWLSQPSTIWGGLAFSEWSGLFEKLASGGDAACGRSKMVAIPAIAALDISELVLLSWLLSTLARSLISSFAPVTAVTGIAVFPA
jgi:hypothetical protein